jgi:hypothetical protein
MLAHLARRKFALTVAGRTALFMKNHPLVSCVSLVQCLMLNLLDQAPRCIGQITLL